MTAAETEILARFPGVTFAIAAAELAREGDARRRVDENKIATGRMSQGEADERQRILAAIAADLERIRAFWPRLPHQGEGPEPQHVYTWRDRDRTLLLELDQRRRFYPEWTAAGRLAQADADRRVKILEAIHALYEEGLDWPADPEIRAALTYGIMQRRDPHWIDCTAFQDPAHPEEARSAVSKGEFIRTALARAAELGIIPAQQEELAFA